MLSVDDPYNIILYNSTYMYELQSRGRGLLTSRIDSGRFHLLIIILLEYSSHGYEKGTVVANQPQLLSTVIRDKYERYIDKTDKKLDSFHRNRRVNKIRIATVLGDSSNSPPPLQLGVCVCVFFYY